jgi:4,5-dihydroxyphthalate decarboxylase
MRNIELSLAIGDNPRSRPVLDGRIAPEGIDLRCSRIHASELFWRQLGFQEFEVSEMSMSSLLISISHGVDTWVAIPVFTTRRFFHTGVLVRSDLEVFKPSDLSGMRVGVPEFQQTAALWTRGILQHEYGLDPKSLKWFMERPEEKSHGGMTGFAPPDGIDLQYISTNTDIGEMLCNGELDAALHYISGNTNLVDRSRAQLGASDSGAKYLFNRRAESARYYQKTKFFPINHCVVVRKDIAERYPWVMMSLYSAFLQAKALSAVSSESRSTSSPSGDSSELTDYLDTGLINAKIVDALGTDLYSYGVVANRDILQTIAEYSYEQGLSSRRLALEEIFYAPTLEV